MIQADDSNDFRELHDFRWALFPDNKDFDSLVASSRKPCILLYHNEQDQLTITRLVVVTPQERLSSLEALASSVSGTKIGIKIDKKDASAFLEASADPENQTLFKELIARIFSLFLVTGRPLLFYNCTFFLPLDLALDNELDSCCARSRITVRANDEIERYRIDPPASLLTMDKKEWGDEDKLHAQAYEFFYTHLQGQLYESTNPPQSASVKPIIHRRIRKDCLKDLSLDLVDKKVNSDGTEVTKTTTASIEDVSLYEYYNGICLLAVRVEHPENKRLSEPEPPYPVSELISDCNWWRALVFGDDDWWSRVESLQIEDWLRYTKLVRILFSSFHEQLEEGKIAPLTLRRREEIIRKREVSDPFSPVIVYFLEQFLDIDTEDLTRQKRLRQVADERMFAHAAYVLAGPSPEPGDVAMEEFERLFSFALYVDHGADALDPHRWAYDRDFTRQLMEQHTLRRWQSIGSLSGFTDYSSVFMGFGWFFHHVTAPIHVPYVYAKIQILVLFYRATMNQLDRRITLATRDLMEKKHHSTAFVRLRRYFIKFTNDYWFRELTPQIQGKEISNLMMAQQSLDDKYELLKDKIERATEYSQSLKDKWFQDRADIASWFAFVLAVGALLMSVFDCQTGALGNSIIAGATLLIILGIFGIRKLKQRCREE